MQNNYLLNKELKNLLEDTKYSVSILSNASSYIFHRLSDLNWVGFYLLKDNKLMLGPFQGNPACIEIPLSKGVCGTCAKTEQTIVVNNVHQFEGHIACDSASNSEICVPLFIKEKFYGLLDIDSPILNRFSKDDQYLIEALAKEIEKALEGSM